MSDTRAVPPDSSDDRLHRKQIAQAVNHILKTTGAAEQQNNALKTSEIGQNVTPNLSRGTTIFVNADSGAAVTLNKPTGARAAARCDISIANHTGGDMFVHGGTDVALSASLTGASIPNGSIVTFPFKLDGDGKWRQAAAHCTTP